MFSRECAYNCELIVPRVSMSRERVGRQVRETCQTADVGEHGTHSLSRATSLRTGPGGSHPGLGMRRSCLGYELLSRPDPVLLDEGVGGRIRSFRITAVRATLDGFPPGHVGCVLPFEVGIAPDCGQSGHVK